MNHRDAKGPLQVPDMWPEVTCIVAHFMGPTGVLDKQGLSIMGFR